MSNVSAHSQLDAKQARAGTKDGSEESAMPYLNAAIPVGLIGASAVAIYILLLDTLAGNPLGTPSALGATLLAGQAFDPTAPISPALVFGYTLLHGATFIAVAAGAVSAEVTLRENGVSLVKQVLLGVFGLILVLQLLFVAMSMMLGVPWVGEIGFERILAANVIAALAMALTIVVRTVTREQP